MESLDRHLESIDGSLATIAHVFVKISETGLLDLLVAQYGDAHRACSCNHVAQAASPEQSEPIPESCFIVTDEEINEGKWMSRKEAWMRLGVVKSTLEGMILSGELDAYRKTSDRHKKKPYVWLKRTDVEALYGSYTLRKGKEKRP